LFFAEFREPFSTAIASISLTGIKPFLNNLVIATEPLSLKERSFIRIHAEPVQTIQNCLYIFWRRPLPIRVLNSENERSAEVPGMKPAEKRSPNTAKMQYTCRTGGKSGSYGHAISAPISIKSRDSIRPDTDLRAQIRANLCRDQSMRRDVPEAGQVFGQNCRHLRANNLSSAYAKNN
jgi:hypothetical protein